MLVCKLAQGVSDIIRIEQEGFEASTLKRAPWYQKHNGEDVQYAVCPACDNPIQIIALYKRSKHSPRAHGRHVPRTIAGLAEYRQENYDNCIYANPNITLDRSNLLPEGNRKAEELLLFLRDNFDIVTKIVQNDIGIVFTEGLARSMLSSFLSMRGHCYIGTNMCNLPWMFAYMTTHQNLYGRRLLPWHPLHNALSRQEGIFFEYNQVKAKRFVDLGFCFIEHKIRPMPDARETIQFVVALESNTIFKREIVIRPLLLQERLHNTHERNDILLNIAKELIDI